jgi:DNA-binding response OmpR family regulator
MDSPSKQVPTMTNAVALQSTRLRVAVLEDDVELRERVLLPGLRDFGFDAIGIGSAVELDQLLKSGPFDMVVLDVGLPDANGFEVAQRLRHDSGVGIVMLTGRNASSDRIRGLNEGADAYLSKPVVLEELVATLHSLARRLRKAAPVDVSQGQWHLDSNGWCLISPTGRSIALTHPERQVLIVLTKSPGIPVTHEVLIDALTDKSYDFDPHRLSMLIYRLRSKIAGQTGESLPVRAVRGAGYVMLR